MKKIVIKRRSADWTPLNIESLLRAMKKVRKIYYRKFDAVEN